MHCKMIAEALQNRCTTLGKQTTKSEDVTILAYNVSAINPADYSSSDRVILFHIVSGYLPKA